MKLIKILGVAAGVMFSLGAMAQQVSTTQESNPSARPIPEHDILFKKVVWRKIDLREKQNRPMFSENREITKIIINAVKSGELVAYKTDSVNVPLTSNEFIENMTPREGGGGLTEEEIAAGFGNQQEEDDAWGAALGGNAAPAATGPVSNEYFAKQLYLLELKENVVFDKKRSRMYHDIQTITIKVPATLNPLGFEQVVGSFKMSDLARVFRNNPEAIWFNAQNDAQHKNLADAFEMWLFSSYITKISNPNDRGLADIYGAGKKGLLAAQEAAEALIEYEYSLWSY